MSELLNSIKADLTDRRLLPLVALVGVALIAALAYAVLGGSSGSNSPGPIAGVTPAVQAGGLQVSTTTPDRSVAETTDGAKEQRSGKARNPFAPLPQAKTAESTPAASSTPQAASTETSSKSSGSTGSGSSETPKTEPTKKAKPKKAGYHVAVLFGLFPAGASAETVTLTPYENLKLQTPLPSAKQALIVFRGVTAGGKSATFTLLGEAILHGSGACLPNASQCQAIDLKPGQVEQLEYLGSDGTIATYELRVVSITAAKASGASASASAASVKAGWAESKAGKELLRHSGLLALPFLRYSSQPGVLVFASHKASSAHRHSAAQQRRYWR
jgi:hypothetical protein